MTAKEKLSNALEIVDKDNVSINLYLITRHWKEGVKKKAKIIDKYDFKARNVDLSEDMNIFFKGIAKKQLTKASKNDNYQLEEYAVISDDLGDKIYTYALNNALSFSGVINDQLLKGNTDTLTSLEDVQKDLWAYCLKFSCNNQVVYTFRKSSKGKVATDQARTKLEKIASYFDTDDAELKVSMEKTISFDDKVDCLYFNNEFLILRKSAFEQIVGLEEELTNAATEVVDIIGSTELVDGIELLTEQIKENRSILRTLSNIGKKGTHTSFNSSEIDKMKEALKTFEGRELKLTDAGKIHLENKEDVSYFVKLLNDYYKQGFVSGKYYGTNSGTILAVSSK